jgi:UDP-N-acetylglucosamine--N-acetylmuramyl-(pentapeptide) pyrophosphoryl-undecaprenol N-acetylglucosamine transferase
MKPNAKIMVAGGGTGGHSIPNVVISRLIQKHLPEVTCFHILSDKAVDQEIVRIHRLQNVIHLPPSPWAGKKWLERLKSLSQLALNVLTCFKLFLTHKPSLVIGVGGYSSAAAVVAAWMLRIPIVLQEQNRIVGVVNRWLGIFAKCLLLGFPDADRSIPLKFVRKKCVFSGNYNLAMLDENPPPPVEPQEPLLFISGGSQGAKPLNEAFVAILPDLMRAHPHLQVVWQCGDAWEALMQKKVSSESFSSRVRVFGFEKDLLAYYRRATVCICRAGALTLMDIVTSEAPAILVPFPYAADRHQDANAEFLVQARACRLVRQHGKYWAKDLLASTDFLLRDGAQRQLLVTHLKQVKQQLPGPNFLLQQINTHARG